MLNGKFFTGLPPGMIEARGASKNRLESHLFWPDESKVESASESRNKRRSSLQSSNEKSAPLKSQLSVDNGHNDVNTRQMFQKEFTKSSIHFNDVIHEDDDNVGRRRVRGRPMKQEIAAKPTATKMKLPAESVIDEEYTNAKKNQAYTSKIEFYDFVNDDNKPEQRRNNERKPKMDMNDKREVERNTKNSPKLQVKRNVKSLSMAEQRDQFTPERDERNEERSSKDPQPSRSVREDNRRVEERIRRESPYQSYEDSRNAEDFYDRREIPERRMTRNRLDDDDYYPSRGYERSTAEPKKILKPSGNQNRYYDNSRDDIDYIENGIRNTRILSSPKKHVTYDDEIAERHYYDRYEDDYAMRHDNSPSTMGKTGSYPLRTSSNHRNNANAYGSDYQRHINETSINDDQYMETGSGSGPARATKPLNTDNNKNNLYNGDNRRAESAAERKITPKLSTTTNSANTNTNRQATAATTTQTQTQKHFRSSLCFSNGEIIASNESGGGGGANVDSHDGIGTTITTPTLNNRYKRNARNAATQRVSVGLPD